MSCFPRWTEHGAWRVVNGLVQVAPRHPLRGGLVQGQLVTNSRFLVAGSYSSRIRSTGSRARCLSFGGKTMDLASSKTRNKGRDARGASRALGIGR